MDGASKLRLLPHEGHVSLAFDPGQGGFVLVHKLTAETVAVPGPGSFRLHFASTGYGFLVRDTEPTNEPLWIASKFRMQVYTSSQGRYCCRFPAEHGHLVKWLDELQKARRQNLQLRLDAPPLRAADLTVAAWTMAQHGCHCWWSLPAIHKCIGLGARPGQVGRWTQHGWKAWCALAQKLELGPHALRLGLLAGQGPAQLGDDAEASGRVLTEKSASTHALIASLGKWSCEDWRQGLRNAHDRNCCLEFLRLPLSQLHVEQERLRWAVYRGPCAWEAPPRGGDFTLLDIADGAVELPPPPSGARWPWCGSAGTVLGPRRWRPPEHPTA